MLNNKSVKVTSRKNNYMPQLAIVNMWLRKATSSKGRHDVQISVEPSCGCLMLISQQLVQSAHSPICLKTYISIWEMKSINIDNTHLTGKKCHNRAINVLMGILF